MLYAGLIYAYLLDYLEGFARLVIATFSLSQPSEFSQRSKHFGIPVASTGFLRSSSELNRLPEGTQIEIRIAMVDSFDSDRQNEPKHPCGLNR